MYSGQPMEAGQGKESNRTFNTAVPEFEKSISVRKKSGRQFSEIGALGIISQALMLCRLRFKFFVMLFLFIMFPMALFAVICEYIIYRYWLRDGINFQQASESTNTFDPPPIQLWGLLILFFLIIGLTAIVCEAAINLASSAMLYAVGLHYSGHDVSFKGVMRVCITSKWMRLTVTRLCKYSLLYILIGMYLLASLFYILIDKRQASNFMVVGLVALAVLVLIVDQCLEIIFMVADSVSVLEKAYGWAAVAKSLRLLKGKRLVGASFLLLWLVTSFITTMLGAFLVYLVVINTSTVGVLRAMVGAVTYSAWLVYLWRLKVLSAGIFYVSCKTYHKESLMEAIHHTGTALEYKRIKIAVFRTDSPVPASAEVGGQELDVRVGGQPVNVDAEV